MVFHYRLAKNFSGLIFLLLPGLALPQTDLNFALRDILAAAYKSGCSVNNYKQKMPPETQAGTLKLFRTNRNKLQSPAYFRSGACAFCERALSYFFLRTYLKNYFSDRLLINYFFLFKTFLTALIIASFPMPNFSINSSGWPLSPKLLGMPTISTGTG